MRAGLQEFDTVLFAVKLCHSAANCEGVSTLELRSYRGIAFYLRHRAQRGGLRRAGTPATTCEAKLSTMANHFAEIQRRLRLDWLKRERWTWRSRLSSYAAHDMAEIILDG